VEQAIETNQEFAEGYGVHIRVEAVAEVFDVQADPDRFVQVITNQLSNTVKFPAPGEEVVVSLETRGDKVLIAVRDHGAGIPAEFKPRVFEKFAQANNGDGQHMSGTGLGLSIVRQIVLHMGGEVGFNDAPDGGTVFYVDLPSAGRLADRETGEAVAPSLWRHAVSL
jgi:signal transduction histidine kinase